MTNRNSDIDIVYEILQQQQQPMYFKELITKSLEAKAGVNKASAHAIAEVHTQINMDSRFVHMGKGMWGLAEWSPRAVSRAAVSEETETAPAVNNRRAKLFEGIQQEYAEQSIESDKE